MAAVATAPQTETQKLPLPTIHARVARERRGNLEVPGLTRLTPWELLCGLCHDDYESARGAGEGPGFGLAEESCLDHFARLGR